MTQFIGNLVTSNEFNGIGKVYAVDEIQGVATITFFESPEAPNARSTIIQLDSLQEARLKDEAIIYCVNPLYSKWQRARYGGPRPHGEHLVIFRRGETDVMTTSDIYVINIDQTDSLNPRAFLAQRCCDTPLFLNHRSDFINSYIEQRNSCRSISSALSSGIELEAYQLAIVRRVLQDDIKKYLLADEVGLGKTIEAGMIIREIMINDFSHKAIISVPKALIQQWENELTQRFFLGALLDEDIVVICSHEDLTEKILEFETPPEIIVIDEAHKIACKGWSKSPEIKQDYNHIAEICAQSEVCLLLSGTPLSGNETNFLSMLHLLNPESYPLTSNGINDFKIKIAERESLGGIYQALTPNNDNTTLTELLEQIKAVIPSDLILNNLINIAEPLVDWLEGEEESDERAQAVKNIRLYLGENYRLHQRMLRNRREDPDISRLFPGLSGLETLPWTIDESNLSVEQSLEAFRDEFLTTDTPAIAITNSNFKDWIAQALSNPILIAEKATKALSDYKGEIEAFEIDALEDMIKSAKEEQEEKDFIFVSFISQWLESNPTGKAIVFAGNACTADHVTNVLQKNIGDGVEKHSPGSLIKFSADCTIRILVCDEHGEDGLNLHGGKKIVVHYDLPLSISRIEQRIGRVNRYSADISASPIKSIALRPCSTNYSYYWLNLLADDIDIFNRSVASLQYILEPHIEKAWNQIATNGHKSFIELGELLRNENGLIHRERLKIHAQEQLNNLESEIDAAKEYSRRIIESDEQAELQADKMQNWLTKGLLFRRKAGEIESTFRYEYKVGTLMDCDMFISNCLLGIDFEHSTHTAPVTHLMSFDRDKCSQGNNIHPFRYGQPFLNTIYSALNTDSRGISAAQIRFIKNAQLAAPLACFKIEWLVSHNSDNQIYSDELYPPHIISHWLTSSGELIQSESIINLLNKPYNKVGEISYKDVNLRTERWENIEEYFPEKDWAELINNIHDSGNQHVIDALNKNPIASFAIECLSFSVIIIASME